MKRNEDVIQNGPQAINLTGMVNMLSLGTVCMAVIIVLIPIIGDLLALPK